MQNDKAHRLMIDPLTPSPNEFRSQRDLERSWVCHWTGSSDSATALPMLRPCR
jgi:hypothetical protein